MVDKAPDGAQEVGRSGVDGNSRLHDLHLSSRNNVQIVPKLLAPWQRYKTVNRECEFLLAHLASGKVLSKKLRRAENNANCH